MTMVIQYNKHLTEDLLLLDIQEIMERVRMMFIYYVQIQMVIRYGQELMEELIQTGVIHLTRLPIVDV